MRERERALVQPTPAMPNPKSPRNLILVHWHADEAEELAKPLRAAGWIVRMGVFEIKDLKASPPVALLISLRRLPSHGREIADAVRFTKWGRAMPIVFFDGEPDKVEATRRKFPAAQFTTWEALPHVLEKLVRDQAATDGQSH
jgi:hypothetical protein